MDIRGKIRQYFHIDKHFVKKNGRMQEKKSTFAEMVNKLDKKVTGRARCCRLGKK